GLALGLIGAEALTRLLRSLLYGVCTTDIAAFMSAPLLLGAVVVFACLVSARRATRVAPARVVRSACPGRRSSFRPARTCQTTEAWRTAVSVRRVPQRNKRAAALAASASASASPASPQRANACSSC